MSLINQMLKDLEARRGVAAGDRVLDALPASAHGHATGRGVMRLAWWLSALVIAILLALVAYLLWTRPVTGVGSVTGAPAPVVAADMVSTAPVSAPARPFASVSAQDDGATATPSRSPSPVATATPASLPGSATPPAGQTGARAEAPNLAPTLAPASTPARPSSALASGKQARPMAPGMGTVAAQATAQVSAMQRNPGTESKPAAAAPVQAPVATPRGVATGAKGMEAATAAVAAEDTAGAGDMHKRQRPLTPTQRAEQAYRRALAEFARGDADTGEQALRAALRDDPDYLPAREVLAGVLLRGGRLVEAGELLREGLQRAPEHVLFARLYARVLLAQGQTNTAVHLLERHRPAAGAQQPDYDALLAALYQRSGRYAQAAGLYRRLVTLRPGAGAWWLGLGLALEGTGKLGQAAEAYRQALSTGSLPAASLTYVKQRLSVLGHGAE